MKPTKVGTYEAQGYKLEDYNKIKFWHEPLNFREDDKDFAFSRQFSFKRNPYLYKNISLRRKLPEKQIYNVKLGIKPVIARHVTYIAGIELFNLT